MAALIRRMEQTGAIEGYHHPGRCLLKTPTAGKFAEIVEICPLSGTSCTMVKVRTA